LPRPLPRPEPPQRGLEKPPLTAAMAAGSAGAGSTAAKVSCCWWAWMANLHGDSADVLEVVFTQHDTQEDRKALKEEKEKEWAGLMPIGAQLQHLVKQLGWLPPAQGLHGVDLFHTLKLSEIVLSLSLMASYASSSGGLVTRSKTVRRHSLGKALTTRSNFTCSSSMLRRRNRDSAMPNHASEFFAQNRGRRREPLWLL
jgi:hypothetical protein